MCRHIYMSVCKCACVCVCENDGTNYFTQIIVFVFLNIIIYDNVDNSVLDINHKVDIIQWKPKMKI